jgi:hypothetical protein
MSVAKIVYSPSKSGDDIQAANMLNGSAAVLLEQLGYLLAKGLISK